MQSILSFFTDYIEENKDFIQSQYKNFPRVTITRAKVIVFSAAHVSLIVG